jgi:UPF0755 protein
MVRRIKHHGIFILLSAGILVLIFGAVLFGFAMNEVYFLRPGDDTVVVRVEIPEGATQASIGVLLKEQELVSSPFLFKLYTKWRDADTEFQQGTFDVVRGSSMRRIVNQLLAGREATEQTITIIEGWTLQEMAAYLDRESAISENEFTAAARAGGWEEDFTFLKVKPSGADLEGFLFPDTYRVFADASGTDVVRKQLTNFEQKVGKISYDDLILASIVEREVRGERDQRMVADLFLRRIEIGMGLQADSTVNYVTGKNTPAISFDDTRLDTPYNTYKHRGLPPGPISNPGLESIEAVRNPLKNDFLYFLTDPAGNVHYGRTFEEHNQNKAQYLR